jgi:hypothetical protein
MFSAIATKVIVTKAAAVKTAVHARPSFVGILLLLSTLFILNLGILDNAGVTDKLVMSLKKKKKRYRMTEKLKHKKLNACETNTRL